MLKYKDFLVLDSCWLRLYLPAQEFSRHDGVRIDPTLPLSITWSLGVAWLLTRAARQGRILNRLDPAVSVLTDRSASLEVIVPARDEAANIGRCVAGLLRQTFPAERTCITVVDDDSRDATAAIVMDLVHQHRRLRLLHAPPLPQGWTGKAHACWFAASASRADWLCFVDADVFAEDALLAASLTHGTSNHLDFLSLTPRQFLVSFAERLVMPCGLYLLSFTQDLAPMQAPRGDDATATGQFILVRRTSYLRVGGHEAVRSAVAEDVALARLMKRAGLRVSLAGGDLLMSTRMYTGWATLWIGVSKNLVDMFGGRIPTVRVAALSVVLAWTAVLLPAVEAVDCAREGGGACVAFAIASTSSSAAFALHIAGAIFFRIPAWYGLLFPFGYTAGALMALDSVRRRATGRVRWKGRTYP